MMPNAEGEAAAAVPADAADAPHDGAAAPQASSPADPVSETYLLDLPAPLLAQVLAGLGSADAIVRAACTCRALRALITGPPLPGAPQFKGVTRLCVRRAHPPAALIGAADWIPHRFPDLGDVDFSRAPALSEDVITALIAPLQHLQTLRVPGASGWCGNAALRAVGGRLRRLEAPRTAVDLNAWYLQTWPGGNAVTQLTRLNVSGAAGGVWRCRVHGRTTCGACATLIRPEDMSTLGRLLVGNHQTLVSLDLSNMPNLTEESVFMALGAARRMMLHGTARRPFDRRQLQPLPLLPGVDRAAPTLGRLRELSVAGCGRLQPPLRLFAAAPRLVMLDVSGTDADDSTVFAICKTLPCLRRLGLTGCTAVTDAGAHAIACAPALRSGTLRALGLGRLLRVTVGAFEEMFDQWARAAAARAAVDAAWQRRRRHCRRAAAPSGANGADGSGDGEAGSSCGLGNPRRGRIRSDRRVFLHGWSSRGSSSSSEESSDEDSSSCASSSSSDEDSGGEDSGSEASSSEGGVASGYWPAHGAQRRQHLLWLDVSGSTVVDGATLHALAAVAAVRNSSGARSSSSSSSSSHSSSGSGGTPSSGDSSGRSLQVPLIGLGALLASGCRLEWDDLPKLASSGLLRRLVALDMSHCEPLRRAPLIAETAGIAAEAEAAAAPAGAERAGGKDGSNLSAGTNAGACTAPLPPQNPLAAALASGAAPPQRLRILRLDGCHLTDEAASCLAHRLGPSLRELSLIGCRPLGDAGLRAFSQCCTQLRTLAVGGAAHHWREDRALADTAALACLTRLRVARRSMLSDAALAAVLAGCTRLCALELAGCYSLTDRGLAAIPLSVREVIIAGADAVVTAAPLARLTRLRRLRLSAAPGITAAALQMIVAACLELTDLEAPDHLGSAVVPMRGRKI